MPSTRKIVETMLRALKKTLFFKITSRFGKISHFLLLYYICVLFSIVNTCTQHLFYSNFFHQRYSYGSFPLT